MSAPRMELRISNHVDNELLATFDVAADLVLPELPWTEQDRDRVFSMAERLTDRVVYMAVRVTE
jgi:hypothetical protein